MKALINPTPEELFEEATKWTRRKSGSGVSMSELIGQGLDVHRFDDSGLTPLHRAVENQRQDDAAALHAAGVCFNVRDKYNGYSPLHFAVKMSRKPTRMVDWLGARGADMNCQDVDGNTPLHLALERDLSLPWVQTLLAAGASPATPRTAMMLARLLRSVRSGGVITLRRHRVMLTLLLESGADLIGADSTESYSLLHEYCELGYLDGVKQLLAAGADANRVDGGGGTALDALVSRRFRSHWKGDGPKDKEIVEALIADRLKPGASVVSMIMEGYRKGFETRRKRSMDDIMGSTFELLLRAGLPVDGCRDKQGNTLLHVLCQHSNSEQITTLLESGKVTEVNARNKDGNTPLALMLARADRFPISGYKVLLNCGADAGIPDNQGRTPLDVAEQRKRDRKKDKRSTWIVEQLKEGGADRAGLSCASPGNGA